MRDLNFDDESPSIKENSDQNIDPLDKTVIFHSQKVPNIHIQDLNFNVTNLKQFNNLSSSEE